MSKTPGCYRFSFDSKLTVGPDCYRLIAFFVAVKTPTALDKEGNSTKVIYILSSLLYTMTRIPVEEEEKILSLLLQGKSTRETGKIVGRSSGTVSNVAERNGLDIVKLRHDQLKRAQLVSAYASAERRASVAAKMLDRGEKILEDTWTARDYRDVSVGLAVGLDKLRLELPHDESKGGEILELVDMLRGEASDEEAEE